MTEPDTDDLLRRIARLERRLERERATRAESESIAEDALSRLYEADRLKTIFLNTISHELRTPLTSIAGFTSVLLESWGFFDDDTKRELLGRIDRNADALKELIEELLDFTRQERGTLVLDEQPLDLAEHVGHVLADHEPNLETHTLVRELQGPAPITGDDHALRRVTVNLLTNAVRYSPDGSTITVRVTPDPPTLAVDDEGPGVAEDERETIFEAFYRGSGPGVIESHGTGIGLSVAKQMVLLMGGSIGVTTSPAGGASFRVVLPRRHDG